MEERLLEISSMEGWWLGQFMGGRKERKKRKESKKENHKKKKKKRKKKKRRGREPDHYHAVVGPGQARNGTALREVGVFLPKFYLSLGVA